MELWRKNLQPVQMLWSQNWNSTNIHVSASQHIACTANNNKWLQKNVIQLKLISVCKRHHYARLQISILLYRTESFNCCSFLFYDIIAKELISESKHPTRIIRAKQTNAEVCVVTLLCHVVMTELPVFNSSCLHPPPCRHAVFLFGFSLSHIAIGLYCWLFTPCKPASFSWPYMPFIGLLNRHISFIFCMAKEFGKD